MKIPQSFFENPDTLFLAKSLLGKFLVSKIEGDLTSGMIIETEAYLGESDRACHAFGGRKTKRTEAMYLPGGHLYVYLCYGMHALLNIVTHTHNVPHAILIRALLPQEGIDVMQKRRKGKSPLASGPGTLTQALGITTEHNQEPIGKTLWIEDRGVHIPEEKIFSTARIGVDYAGKDALLPYRFLQRHEPLE